jgi:hypothetical protein
LRAVRRVLVPMDYLKNKNTNIRECSNVSISDVKAVVERKKIGKKE